VEHFGFDEPRREEGKAIKAMRIKELIKEGGVTLVSAPLGFNPEIDEEVKRNLISGQEIFMKRIFVLNE
jgi:hypothetical protein